MDAEHHQVAANGRMLRRQLENIRSDAVQYEISALLGSECLSGNILNHRNHL
jgi:hypothetical protein